MNGRAVRTGKQSVGTIGRLARRLSSIRLLRSPTTKYVALAVAAAVIMIAALSPLASVIVEGWLRRDVELRARLVFRSIRDQVAAGISATPHTDLKPFFERLTDDERILALGFCTSSGQLLYATKYLPKSITCNNVIRSKDDTFAVITDDGHQIHVSAFPISSGSINGHLLLLHDLSYIDARVNEVRFYSILALVGAAVGLGLLATAVVLALLRRWTSSIRSAIASVQRGGVDLGVSQRGDFPASKESARCSPSFGRNGNSPTASTSNGRPRRCTRCSIRSCLAPKCWSSPTASPTFTITTMATSSCRFQPAAW
jgi:hypothetical protein